MAKLTVELRGLEQLKKKLTPDLYASAARHVLGHVSGKIAGTAQDRAPRGVKVTSRVAKRNPPRSAVVRVSQTGVGKRARFFHGPIRTAGSGRTKPHRPPPTPELKAWAAEAGIPVGAVIASVAKRGTPTKPFLREGLAANKGAAQQALGQAERLVESEWSK